MYAKGAVMQKVLRCFLILFSLRLVGHDCNLIIIVDNLQQETVKTEEINMTHQLITALQQKTSAILVSAMLWKNIIDRKKNFAKQLEDSSSLSATIFGMYQTTNQELKEARYNLAVINQKLSHVWFFEKYPELAELSQDDFNQLRFDFLCYIFEFDFSLWRVYNAREGMLLFVPQEFDYHIDGMHEVLNEDDYCKFFDKKSKVVQSLQKLLLPVQDRWVIYLTGHGHPKSTKQGANIAGLKIDEFKDLLDYFNENMDLKLLVYASCYGGGVHTIEPYADLLLNYPIIVTALTDAPIFGFGLFEGVKLPPYDDQFKLEPADIAKHKGLLPYAMQDYPVFFKRAWKGQFDLNLIQLISKFFTCDLLQCHIQKVENFPLIRKSGDLVFKPVKDGLIFKLVQQIISPNSVITAIKPVLLYAKKVKKIKMDQIVPIISMVPGLVSHEIGEFYAPQILFSSLVSQVFLSLEDMQLYKNFIIKKLECINDLLEGQNAAILSHVLILGQENLIPKFIGKHAQAVICFQSEGKFYASIFNEQKITQTMLLDDEQVRIIKGIENFVQQAVDFKAQVVTTEHITFAGYVENKNHQQGLADDCIKAKICKKI